MDQVLITLTIAGWATMRRGVVIEGWETKRIEKEVEKQYAI
jgi:hypothetical protein